MDGARLFNAAAALGLPTAWPGAPADSVMFLVSPKVWRVRSGPCLRVGGVHQAGAPWCGAFFGRRHAAGRHSGRGRGWRAGADDPPVADDHAACAPIGEAIAAMEGFSVDTETVQTNMVFVHTGAGRRRGGGPGAGRRALITSSRTPSALRGQGR